MVVETRLFRKPHRRFHSPSGCMQRDNKYEITNKPKLRANSITSLTSTIAGATTTLSGPTHIVESCDAIASRITQEIEILQARGGQPNLAAAEGEFLSPAQRLRASWNGRPSKIQAIPGDRRLGNPQELAIRQCLDRLDNIGLAARLFIIMDCANAILRRSHQADLDDHPPQVSKHWARRFPERDPEYLIRERRVQEIDRKNAKSSACGGTSVSSGRKCSP